LRVRAGFMDFGPRRGRGANITPRPPSCDTARKIHAPLLRKKRKKVNKRQTDRDREIGNSTRRPTLRAWPNVHGRRTSGRRKARCRSVVTGGHTGSRKLDCGIAARPRCRPNRIR
jgi:hypothetical protein